MRTRAATTAPIMGGFPDLHSGGSNPSIESGPAHGAPQGLSHGLFHHDLDQPGVAKPHFQLGGMDVHIDEMRVAFDEERGGGVPVAREEVRVGGAERTEHQLVPHRASVDENILMYRRSA